MSILLRRLNIAKGSVASALARINLGAESINLRIFRFELLRTLKRGDRLLKTPHAIEGVSVFQLRRKIVWIFLQSRAELRLGAREILFLPIRFGSRQMQCARLA